MAVHRSAAPLDERSLFAEYPFLPGAEKLLEGETVSIRTLLEEPSYDSARRLGRTRIRAAAEDPRSVHDLGEIARADPGVRYLSFLFARLVLSAAPSPAPLRRWAVAEAKRSHGRLVASPVDELAEVARRLQFSMTPEDGRMVVPLVDYVKLATPIREAEFRLPRQDVDRGGVRVLPARAARLLQEAVRLRLSVPIPLADEVVVLLRARESELLEEVVRRMPMPVARIAPGASAIRPDRFPPCLRTMQTTLQRGENLSHAGRFCLAAFLHRVGADEETIVDAYRGAPDFDESITRYQVEHITHRDGGRGYEPPECATLRSHGLCRRDGDPSATDPRDRSPDRLCFEEFLRHPLQYYRLRGGTVIEREDDEAASEGAEVTSRRGSRDRPGAPGKSRSTDPR